VLAFLPNHLAAHLIRVHVQRRHLVIPAPMLPSHLLRLLACTCPCLPTRATHADILTSNTTLPQTLGIAVAYRQLQRGPGGTMVLCAVGRYAGER
jgi:hypothetical protein